MVRIAWAERNMGVLRTIRDRFQKKKVLRGIRIAACLHVTAETAVLMRTLRDAGAHVELCASNPLSTQDDVAAALVRFDRIPVFARNGESRKRYYAHLNAVLDQKPTVTMDDGADLVSMIHGKRSGAASNVIGSTEETTTGVIRLRSMEREGILKFPVIAVNDSKTKHYFDNRYGTGQSTVDGIMRATNTLLAGKVFVVAGYGYCGKGVASRADGMGAKVIVTEINPVRAIEAMLDGFQVATMNEAAPIGDFFVTVTGNINVIRPEHVRRMKDGAVIGNSGHFDVEIDLKGIRVMAKETGEARPHLIGYTLRNGKTIFVIAEGRLLNLAAAEGHPAAVMDMSFANQAMAVHFLHKNSKRLAHRVYTLPDAIDNEIASLKLSSLGISIDRETAEQRKYQRSWRGGT